MAAVRPGSNIAGNPVLLRTCGLNSAIFGDYMQTRAKGLSGEGDVIIGESSSSLEVDPTNIMTGGGRRLGTNGAVDFR